jgi:integrase
MLLTLANRPSSVRKEILQKYIDFSMRCNFPLEKRDIHPANVIQWIFELVETENFDDFNSDGFKHTFYYIIKDSKYPLSLFLKLNTVEKLTTPCSQFNPETFNYIFDLFLEASKQFATNPKGKDLIKKVPSELLEDRNEFGGWFLTNINECFKILEVVDFYIWQDKQGVNLHIDDSDHTATLLKQYLEFMKANYTKAKYKKKRIFVMYVLKLLDKIEQKPDYISSRNMEVIDGFIDTKIAGYAILYKNQKIYGTRWAPRNAFARKDSILHYIKKVIKVEGLTGEKINRFSVFSLNLQNFTEVEKQLGYIPQTERDVLKQFIPFLIGLVDPSTEEYKKLDEFYLKFPHQAPKKKSGPAKRNFIPRKDFLTLLHTAFKSSQSRNVYRHPILLCLDCLAALRISETVQIQVGDFEIDENGLIRNVKNGYGKLCLPDYKSKGHTSGSKGPFHIAIVPLFRELINTYLQTDFMSGYSEKTYLMRSQPVCITDHIFDNVPHPDNEREYAIWEEKATNSIRGTVSDIYKRAAHLFDSKVKGNVSNHDLRRSANNWIVQTPTDLHIRTQARIAEIHLRHKGKKSVNEEHYTDEPSVREYLQLINDSLNFPWDIEALKEWEAERNICSISEEESDTAYPMLEEKSLPTTNYSRIISLVTGGNSENPQTDFLKKEIKQIQKALLEGSVDNKIQAHARLEWLKKELIKQGGEENV